MVCQFNDKRSREGEKDGLWSTYLCSFDEQFHSGCPAKIVLQCQRGGRAKGAKYHFNDILVMFCIPKFKKEVIHYIKIPYPLVTFFSP